MVYGGCTDYALRRGDLHSGTLRDGNHKPTIPFAGALGLNLSTDQNGVESVEFMGGRARRKALWLQHLAESFTNNYKVHQKLLNDVYVAEAWCSDTTRLERRVND